MTVDEAMGDLKEVLTPVHRALSHVTREVRPSDAAFTKLCTALRLLQSEVLRMRESIQKERDWVSALTLDNGILINEVDALRAKLARVEALTEGYEAYIAEADDTAPATRAYKTVIREMRAALRGEP